MGRASRRGGTSIAALLLLVVVAVGARAAPGDSRLDAILSDGAPTEGAAPEAETAPEPAAIDEGAWIPRPWDGGSISIGTANEGYVAHAVSLPAEGDAWRFLPIVHERETTWGTDELVAAVRKAAREVAAAHPGPRLVVGNLGRQHGGPISQSQSHRSGRDADLLFYRLDEDGASVEPDDFEVFECDGSHLEKKIRFDVVRNWALVRSFLTNEAIEVQYIFVSICLKRLLLRHAEEAGEPDALVARAREVLWRPSDSTSHRDHFHVRLYCTVDDLAAGCADEGRYWDWVTTHPTTRLEDARAQARRMRDADAEVRRAAARTIGSAGYTEVSLYLPELLDDPVAAVRMAAHRALVRLDTKDSYGRVCRLLQPPTDPERFVRGLRTLAALSSKGSAWRMEGVLRGDYEPLKALRPDPTTRERMKTLAARGLQRVGRHRSFPLLLEALETGSPDLRAAARKALRRIANHRVAPDEAAPDEVLGAWRRWWRRHHRGDRARWQVNGFRAAGFPVKYPPWSWDAVPGLIAVAKGEAELGWNAHQMLATMARDDAPPYHPDADIRVSRWTSWWEGRQRWRAAKARR